MANISEIDTEEEWTNDAGTELPPEDTVGPAWFNRIIVMPLSPPGLSDGGIIIPESSRRDELWRSCIGRVVSIGPMAYSGRKWELLGMKPEFMPQRGEWWLFDPLQFKRFKVTLPAGKTVRLYFMHEEAMLMRIPKDAKPWDFKIER